MVAPHPQTSHIAVRIFVLAFLYIHKALCERLIVGLMVHRIHVPWSRGMAVPSGVARHDSKRKTSSCLTH